MDFRKCAILINNLTFLTDNTETPLFSNSFLGGDLRIVRLTVFFSQAI